jgi:GNAT superfamily N-acetyltransferase
MNLIIRRATPDDAGSITGIRVASWRVAYRDMLPARVLESLDPSDHRAFFTMLSSPSSWGWVAEIVERPVGFAFLGPSRDPDADDSCCEVQLLYLLPDVWRSGVGTSLVATLLEDAFARDFRRITLWVAEQNLPAQAFYRAMGFRPDGASKTDTRLVDCPVEELRFSKPVERAGRHRGEGAEHRDERPRVV